MICKLCLTDKVLVNASHIYSKFLYRNINEKKLVEIDLKSMIAHKVPKIGVHEDELLCQDCENRILGGRYERYASLTIYNKGILPWEVRRGMVQGRGEFLPCLRYENIDYAKCKLFYLAQLWRAHISQNDFFHEVDLGKYHAERIRQLLLNGDPGSDDEYRVALIVLNADELRATRSIVTPARLSKNGNTYYILHIDTMTCLINISKYNMSSIFKSHISSSRTFDITLIPTGYSNRFFDYLIGKAPNFNY